MRVNIVDFKTKVIEAREGQSLIEMRSVDAVNFGNVTVEGSEPSMRVMEGQKVTYQVFGVRGDGGVRHFAVKVDDIGLFEDLSLIQRDEAKRQMTKAKEAGWAEGNEVGYKSGKLVGYRRAMAEVEDLPWYKRLFFNRVKYGKEEGV